MPLHLTRRPNESFSVFSPAGERLARVTVARGGGEPLLRVEARPELVIRRDDQHGVPMSLLCSRNLGVAKDERG